jgi:hypothetical protein
MQKKKLLMTFGTTYVYTRIYTYIYIPQRKFVPSLVHVLPYYYDMFQPCTAIMRYMSSCKSCFTARQIADITILFLVMSCTVCDVSRYHNTHDKHALTPCQHYYEQYITKQEYPREDNWMQRNEFHNLTNVLWNFNGKEQTVVLN